jgi:hypothetical protein
LSVSHDKAIVIEALKLGNKYRLVNEAKAFSRNHSGKRLTSPTSQLNGYIEFYNVYSKEMPEYVCKQLEKKILAFAKNHMVSLFGTQRRLNILGVLIILLRYLQK